MKKAKLAALISLSLANIAGLCLVTFAWFTAKYRVNSPIDTIQATAVDEITVSHEIFEWNDDLKRGVESLNSDGSYKFSLEQYDSFILDRNANLSKVIRFELKREVLSGDVVTFGLTIPCSGALFDSNDKVTNSISNIIRFKYFVDSTNDGSDPNEIYTKAVALANDSQMDRATRVSFVSLESDDGSITASKKYDITIEGLEFNSETNKTYFFLEYNYDVELINYYYEHSDMEAPSVDTLRGDEVQFIGDIHRMTFGVSNS